MRTGDGKGVPDNSLALSSVAFPTSLPAQTHSRSVVPCGAPTFSSRAAPGSYRKVQPPRPPRFAKKPIAQSALLFPAPQRSRRRPCRNVHSNIWLPNERRYQSPDRSDAGSRDWQMYYPPRSPDCFREKSERLLQDRLTLTVGCLEFRPTSSGCFYASLSSMPPDRSDR